MSELDAEPTPGRVMAHVIRLERVVEKLAGKSLDDLLPQPPAPSQPQSQPLAPSQPGPVTGV